MDTMTHLHRSVFARRQIDLLSWLLTANGVPNVPSVKSMQHLCKKLQRSWGIETIPYNGVFGHKYFVNSISDIIAQVCKWFLIYSLA